MCFTLTKRAFPAYTAPVNSAIKVRESLEKINLDPNLVTISYDEPLAAHCTFRIGGPADILARPRDAAGLRSLLAWARGESVPVFILGGGANLLVADKGIRGLVVDMGGLSSCRVRPADGTMEAGAGLAVSDAAEFAAGAGLGGLDFIYAMPGSVGGAVYMNARCYGSEIGDVLESVEYLDAALEPRTMKPERASFQYKDTPFQKNPWVITAARFRLAPADPAALLERMAGLKADRAAKGHFAAPCAGSVFKNNHAFGQPSGKIIDSLGLRGHRVGGAQVSPGHANIFINSGGATAADMKALIDHVHERVQVELGYDLEPEVVLAGDWD
jgi:UDP-N-acetylmuramate dehydrogenase